MRLRVVIEHPKKGLQGSHAQVQAGRSFVSRTSAGPGPAERVLSELEVSREEGEKEPDPGACSPAGDNRQGSGEHVGRTGSCGDLNLSHRQRASKFPETYSP